jgi:hypothetical protein
LAAHSTGELLDEDIEHIRPAVGLSMLEEDEEMRMERLTLGMLLPGIVAGSCK